MCLGVLLTGLVFNMVLSNKSTMEDIKMKHVSHLVLPQLHKSKKSK